MDEPGYIDDLLDRIKRNSTRADRILRKVLELLAVAWTAASSAVDTHLAPTQASTWVWVAAGLGALLLGSYGFYRVAREITTREKDPEQIAREVFTARSMGTPLARTPLWWRVTAPCVIGLFFAAVYFALFYMVAFGATILVAS